MTKRDQTKVLCLTGMHRSGTSLTASWLEHCGLKLDDGEVYGVAEGNERGHFEDKHFVDLQSAQILRRFTKSHGWIHTGRNAIAIDDEFERGAQHLIACRNAKYVTWGWKDPRSVLFLESWKRIHPDLKVLLLWRSCDEVVCSLLARARISERRNLEIDTLRAIGTWQSYCRRQLAYKNKHPRETLMLPLRAVLENDRAVFDWLSDRWGLRLHYKPITGVFDPLLLRDRRPNWIQRVGSLFGVATPLESSLERASDRV